MRLTFIIVCFASALLVSASSSSDAQVVQKIDPSIRAAGMGDVSNGVFWEPASASWKNPALLGYQRGFTYERGRTEWASMEGLWLRSDRILLGGWGVGVLLAGRPIDGLGGTSLDDDFPSGSRPHGTPHNMGQFREDLNTLAVGVSAAEFMGHLLPRLGHSWPNVARFAEISVGVAFNNSDFCTTTPGLPDVELSTGDYGLLFRLTPYNSFDCPGMWPDFDRVLEPLVGGIRFDAAYGYSRHNYSDAAPTADDPDWDSARASKFLHQGGTIRFVFGGPRILERWLSELGGDWLAESLTPIVSVGIGWDHEEETTATAFWAGGQPGPTRWKTKSSGWELTLADVITLRRGDIDSRRSAFTGSTSGWGLGFKVADYGWLRFDHATVPMTIRPYEMTRTGFTLNLNALAIWRDMRR
jgi:hypothetical protein